MRVSTTGGNAQVTCRPKSASISRTKSSSLKKSALLSGSSISNRRPQSATGQRTAAKTVLADRISQQASSRQPDMHSRGRLRPQSATLKRRTAGDNTVGNFATHSHLANLRPRSAAPERTSQLGKLDSLDETRTIVENPWKSSLSNGSSTKIIPRGTLRPQSAAPTAGRTRPASNSSSGSTRPQSAASLRPRGSKVGSNPTMLRSSSCSAVKFEIANRPLDLSALSHGAGGQSLLTGSSVFTDVSEFGSSDFETAGTQSGYFEDLLVPMPEPAVFLSNRPAGNASMQPAAAAAGWGDEEPLMEGELNIDGAKSSSNYDLVVCVCGHVNLRSERSAHMKVCPLVKAAMSKSGNRSGRFKTRMREAAALQEADAASKIQCVFRGFIARDYVRLRRDLETLMAAKIQAVWRANRGRGRASQLRLRKLQSKHRRQQRAALCIQGLVRSWLAIQFVRRLRTRTAVTKLQTYVRAFIQRRKFRLRLQACRLSATDVQRCWRGHLGRVKVLRLVKRRHHCVTRIQACWRRYQTEKWFVKWRKQKVIAVLLIQRVGRGVLGRKKARTKRSVSTAACSVIQRAFRESQMRHWARRVLTLKAVSATMIQKWQRGYKSRIATRALRTLLTLKAVLLQSVIRMFQACCKRRKLLAQKILWHNRAATLVQAGFRGLRSRKTTKTMRMIKTFTCSQIQRWWRYHHAYKVVHRRKRNYYRIQALVRKYLARSWWLREQAKLHRAIPDILEKDMADLELLSRCDHLFQGCLCPRMTKTLTLQALAKHKSNLRYLYLKFSMDGCGQPEKAFRMSKVQFMSMFKHMGIAKDLADGLEGEEAASAFKSALSKAFDLANEDTVVVLRQEREGQGGTVHEEELEADRYLQLDEFYVAVLRVAMWDPEFAVMKTPKLVENLCQQYIGPFGEQCMEADKEEKSNKEALIALIPGVDGVLDKYAIRMEKIFKQVAASGAQSKAAPGKKIKKTEKKAEKKTDTNDIDAKEFLTFCKAIRVFDTHFSMSAGLDVFVYCNQEEVQKFLVEALPLQDLNQELKMEFAEFMQAFLLLGATRIGIGGKKNKSAEDYKKKFERFCDDVVDLAAKEFSYIVL